MRTPCRLNARKLTALCLIPFMFSACQKTKEAETVSQEKLEPVTITLSDDGCEASDPEIKTKEGTVTITKSGSYTLTGDLSDGQILVDADDTAEVQLRLDGVSIRNSSRPCIYAKQAGRVSVVVKKGSYNTLLSKTIEDDEEADAVIYSACDLLLDGKGIIEIDAKKGHGIAVGKSLEVLGNAKYDILAKKDGVQVKDGLHMQKGKFSIACGNDAIHCDKGSIHMENGSCEIAAGDDGIHAEKEVRIDGGEITVSESREGIEGEDVRINGGTFFLRAEDDGINAVGRKGSLAELEIKGGSILVNAGGDGIDANGRIIVSGGVTKISGSEDGQNGAIDYDTQAVITGGTVVAAGFIKEAKGFEPDSPQPSWSVNLKKKHKEKIILYTEKGEKLISFKPAKRFQSVVISIPEMKFGKKYVIKVGNETQKAKV